MFHLKNQKAFTLIEILIGILIVSAVMVSAFQALTSLGIGKIRLIQNTQTQKQSLYFSEKLFEMIKYGGTIDYEEYFARKIRNNYIAGSTYGTQYLSGHYEQSTGFGNFSGIAPGIVGSTVYHFPPSLPSTAEFYYCASPAMTSQDGCYNENNSFINGLPQAYGQYSFQFIDYNSNNDGDGGDEDGDLNPVGDDDDEYLGEGPNVFATGSNTKELYLINGVKKERTYFRYNVNLDKHHPDYPNASICTTGDNGATYTGSGCLGTIEYLKLEGRDRGMDHLDSNADAKEHDGVIDTWIISTKFTGGAEIVAGTYPNPDDYWQELFPNNINVTEFKVFPHPNIDTDRAWKVDNPQQNVSEQIGIQLGMMPAWKDRKKIKGTPKEYKMTTTINLTDIFTR